MVDMTNDEELNSIFNIQYYPTFKAFSKQQEFGDVFGAKFQNLCDLIKSLNDTEQRLFLGRFYGIVSKDLGCPDKFACKLLKQFKFENIKRNNDPPPE